jgi:16S rRNA (uracil1498-N3)-methyltransferase
MRLHRFYIAPEEAELVQSLWINSTELRNQWLKVLRYRAGDEVVLFDGIAAERLYKIERIEPDAIKLELVTEFERKLPQKHIYLLWSLLKKDKNDWVVQKCTELGISNFIPLLADRSEKTGFNVERATKIAIEAAEQCGRSDIPHIREPLTLAEAIGEYKEKITIFICDESMITVNNQLSNAQQPLGVLIGPEGGWTESELNLLKSENFGSLHLGNLTLRAETAAVAATTKLIQ